MIRTIIVLSLVLLLFVTMGYAQSERKAVRKGNKEFKKGEFLDSEISYRSALEQNPASFKGNFNLGSALYKQDKFEESANLYADLGKIDANADDLAKIYHNLGNSYFNQENYEESVEAYKNSLRHNPNDMETKYNLAQAQRMLQQQQDQDQDQDQDSNEDQDQNEDQEDQQQDQNQDKNQDQQDKNQQEREQEISAEDARRMLEAIQNNEQQVQERVQEEKAKKAKVQVEKNW